MNELQPSVCCEIACHIVVLVKYRVFRLQNSINVRKTDGRLHAVHAMWRSRKSAIREGIDE